MRAIGATVVGRRHVERGTQCEDAFAITQSADRGWTAAVLCDGCGSARYAAEGARFISTELATELLGLSTRLGLHGPGEWVIDAVVSAIATLRDKMRARFGERLNDYAATIVATLVSRQGGFLLHVGDGIATAIGTSSADSSALHVVAQSDPRNGEFANQTFYPTEPDWIRNVWMTPVTRPALVLLCTDGTQEFLYRGNTVKPQALKHILKSVSGDEGSAGERIGAALRDLETQTTSGDDLGIVLIFDEKALDARNGATITTPEEPELEPLNPLDLGACPPSRIPSSRSPLVPTIRLGPLSSTALAIEGFAARHRRVGAWGGMAVGAGVVIALSYLTMLTMPRTAAEKAAVEKAAVEKEAAEKAAAVKEAAEKAAAEEEAAEKGAAEKGAAEETSVNKPSSDNGSQ